MLNVLNMGFYFGSIYDEHRIDKEHKENLKLV